MITVSQDRKHSTNLEECPGSVRIFLYEARIECCAVVTSSRSFDRGRSIGLVGVGCRYKRPADGQQGLTASVITRSTHRKQIANVRCLCVHLDISLVWFRSMPTSHRHMLCWGSAGRTKVVC